MYVFVYFKTLIKNVDNDSRILGIAANYEQDKNFVFMYLAVAERCFCFFLS